MHPLRLPLMALFLVFVGVSRMPAQSLVNMSALAQTSSTSVLTSGFVIANGPSKTVLVRAIGPSLAGFGVSGVLPKPMLNVLQGNTVIATNSGWGGSAALAAVFQQVGAFSLAANSLDSALVLTLPAGVYTAQAIGSGVTTGNCLIEVYDVSGVGSQLINASTLLPIGTTATTFGFVISPGSGTRRLLIRCIGPTLTNYGVTGVLSDPNLVVVNSATQQVVSQNDDWSSGNTTSLTLAFSEAGAFSLPNPSKDSALVADFPPGNYGVLATGNNGSSGRALVEIYDITPSGPNVVSIGATQSAADDSGKNPGVFTVTRSGDVTLPLTVSYSTGGSAISGNDYTALPGVVTIPAGSTSATVTVNALPVITSNASTQAVLSLMSGSGYTLGSPTSATVTITDLPPTLYVATLRPAGSATGSTASGTATILVDPDNTYALVNVSFANLSSTEVVAHLELGTPGQNPAYVFNLEPGQVSNQQWTFAPTGPYTVANLISALASGNIFAEIDTANYPSGELTGKFIQAAGSQTFSVPAAPPALAATVLGAGTDSTNAVRLLTQATFGATTADIATVTSGGVSAWIKSQMAIPNTSHLAALRADAAAFPNPVDPTIATYYYVREVNQQAAWWKIALTAPDELRQRVAFALSEIFVVSDQGTGLANRDEAFANYYDMLCNDAFGNYRQLIQDVTLSPVMGTYLNTLQNAKANPTTGTAADENYAREVQQLFTIGLVQLQPDGTLQLDVTGQPIPTYGQATIVQTANVFTGWSFASPNGDFYYNPLTAGIFNGPMPNTNAWLNPMQGYDAEHDMTAKTIVGGVVIPAGGTTAGDLKIMLDTLFNHQNAGPFFCKQMIQKLVTSNPSPAYVYRVAQVFANDGTGTRGNLAAVVTAILTDYEARTTSLATSNVGYGKLIEPLIRVTAFLRAFNATPANGRYIEFVSGAANNSGIIASPIGTFEESVMESPTVFNFFAPSFVLPGVLASAGLVGPEFQITDAASSIEVPNALYTYTFNRTAPQPTNFFTMDFSSLTALAATPASMINQVSLLFCGNAMSSATSARILTAIQSLPASATSLDAAETAVFLTVTSQEAAIQR